MPLAACNPFFEFLLLVIIYLITLWFIARSFIEKCLLAIGKPFHRFAFWFTFFGWTERSPWGVKQHEMPLWGMTDDDLKIVISYRAKFRPVAVGLMIVFAIALMVAVPGIQQTVCRR
jgi:hypothetical protein